jgi:hypothetical protein
MIVPFAGVKLASGCAPIRSVSAATGVSRCPSALVGARNLHRSRTPLKPSHDAGKESNLPSRGLPGASRPAGTVRNARWLLERFWPGPVGVCSAIDSPISLAFPARYRSPSKRRGWVRSAAGLEREIAEALGADPDGEPLPHLVPLTGLGAVRRDPARRDRRLPRALPATRPRALRTVGRAWCRVVWRCWQTTTPMTPNGTPVHPNGGPTGRARSA